jgi:hypothetical protein
MRYKIDRFSFEITVDTEECTWTVLELDYDVVLGVIHVEDGPGAVFTPSAECSVLDASVLSCLSLVMFEINDEYPI